MKEEKKAGRKGKERGGKARSIFKTAVKIIKYLAFFGEQQF